MAVVDLFICCFLLFCLGLKRHRWWLFKTVQTFWRTLGIFFDFFFFHFHIFAPFILGRRIRSPNFLPSRTVEWPGCHVQILCEGDGHSSWWVKGSSPGNGWWWPPPRAHVSSASRELPPVTRTDEETRAQRLVKFPQIITPASGGEIQNQAVWF